MNNIVIQGCLLSLIGYNIYLLIRSLVSKNYALQNFKDHFKLNRRNLWRTQFIGRMTRKHKLSIKYIAFIIIFRRAELILGLLLSFLYVRFSSILHPLIFVVWFIFYLTINFNLRMFNRNSRVSKILGKISGWFAAAFFTSPFFFMAIYSVLIVIVFFSIKPSFGGYFLQIIFSIIWGATLYYYLFYILHKSNESDTKILIFRKYREFESTEMIRFTPVINCYGSCTTLLDNSLNQNYSFLIIVVR
jgi:hypothetical protein